MSLSLNRSTISRVVFDQKTPWLLVVIAVLVVTYILTSRQGLRAFPNDDTVIYGIIAKFWSQGELPYRDLVDHKPPGIYIFYRVCFWFWGESPAAVWRGFYALIGIASALLIWAFARINVGAFGLGVGVSFAMFFFTDPFRLGETAFLNTELLVSGCLALALAFTVLSQNHYKLVYLLLAGIAFGCALVSKQPAATFAPALLVQIIIASWRRPFSKFLLSALASIGVFSLGATLPTLAIVGWYAYQGALPDLFYWAYEANLRYTGLTLASLFRRYPFFLGHWGLIWKQLSQPFALPFLVALYAAPALFIIRRSWLDVIIALWVLGGIGTSMLSSEFGHTHYLVFYQVPVSLLLGGLFLTLSGICSRFKWGSWRVAPLSLMVLFLIFRQDLSTLRNSIQLMLSQPAPTLPLVYRTEVSPLMDELTGQGNAGDSVFFLGPSPKVLFLSHLPPASKYIYYLPSRMLSKEQFCDELIQGMLTKKPLVAFVNDYREGTFTPDQPDKWGEMSRVFLEHYEPWGFGVECRIYKRKASAPQ